MLSAKKFGEKKDKNFCLSDLLFDDNVYLRDPQDFNIINTL